MTVPFLAIGPGDATVAFLSVGPSIEADSGDGGDAEILAAIAALQVAVTALSEGQSDIEDTLATLLTAVSALSSGSIQSVVASRVAIGATAGWPKEFVIGDARLTALTTAPKLFVKDIDDNILAELGTKNFADSDFRAVLRLAPLTPTTRELSTVPSTIEISNSDSPGIVFNNSTAGSEYFELQMPASKTSLGVIRTVYSAQFIMNWGSESTYETTINLGDITFVRKNGATS